VAKTITQKIIESNLVSGRYIAGSEIAIKVNQTLTHDATGVMAFLHLQSLKVPRVRVELSVTYIDHNTIQSGFESADDHRYLESVARRYGIHLSRAGNGICHQVHLERFAKPGKVLLGADSHTPTAGGLGMLAIGAGSMDVAIATGGGSFWLRCPKVTKINLKGKLSPWVSAKDVIFKILEKFTTKGNVGYVFEYSGEGVSNLTVPERATIANMGTECGVTTSVFPSDETTRLFLRAQRREEDWVEIKADTDAEYETSVDIDLSKIVPLTATPHSPENIQPVKDIGEIEVDQVCIGSCTNSSYKDLATVARILNGKTAHPKVSLVIVPGSRQVLENLSLTGHLTDLIAAGARIAECACTFCSGNSYSPSLGAVSLRTSNRNFPGRSGTPDANVYLVSPQTAAAAVITGRFTDPRDLGIDYPEAKVPEKFHVDDRMIVRPEDTENPSAIAIYKGPNIGYPPLNSPLPEGISGEVTIKLGDGITTDHIIPSGAKMKYRSNVQESSDFIFAAVDPGFPERAAKIRDAGRHNIIVAGLSYGQGSSREFAASCPMYLGVKAVIAKSFERIHKANLINFGIIPFIFKDAESYDTLNPADALEIPEIRNAFERNAKIFVENVTRGIEFEVGCEATEREKKILLAGGALNFMKGNM
jgi:aconitate hydratase